MFKIEKPNENFYKLMAVAQKRFHKMMEASPNDDENKFLLIKSALESYLFALELVVEDVGDVKLVRPPKELRDHFRSQLKEGRDLVDLLLDNKYFWNLNLLDTVN